jgi:hypothetical protein
MKSQQLHWLIQQFFDATEKDNATFLQSLRALLHKGKRMPLEEPQVLRQLSASVAEPAGQYDAASLDGAPCTVGEALQQFLDSNALGIDDAAKHLGISTAQMHTLLAEMMPLTSTTVPTVAQFFREKYGVPALTLRQWLVTGLRDVEIQRVEQGSPRKPVPASTRIAARRKK